MDATTFFLAAFALWFASALVVLYFVYQESRPVVAKAAVLGPVSIFLAAGAFVWFLLEDTRGRLRGKLVNFYWAARQKLEGM